MKILKQVTLTLVAVLFSAQLLAAQKTWEKDWQKWNQDDCLRILTNSPWASSFSDISVETMTNALNRRSIGMEVAAPKIILRLYSSQTIQRAMYRQMQFAQNYDKLGEKQKAEFDEKAKGFLSCEECRDYYVLIMLQPAGRNAKTLVGLKFKDYDLERLRDLVYLTNDKGEKRELARFIAPKTDGGFAIFYFQKLDENQRPLNDTASQKLTLNFRRGKFDETYNFLIDKVEFDPSKMIVNGKADF
jgi:hypothetical protein